MHIHTIDYEPWAWSGMCNFPPLNDDSLDFDHTAYIPSTQFVMTFVFLVAKHLVTSCLLREIPAYFGCCAVPLSLSLVSACDIGLHD